MTRTKLSTLTLALILTGQLTGSAYAAPNLMQQMERNGLEKGVADVFQIIRHASFGAVDQRSLDTFQTVLDAHNSVMLRPAPLKQNVVENSRPLPPRHRR
ncbi:MAG: hypothetical protein AB7P76_08400 [Candidatus Melainabacteria bacterium]